MAPVQLWLDVGSAPYGCAGWTFASLVVRCTVLSCSPLQACKMGDSKPAASALSTVKPFINGGLSGMAATCIIQPIDMVKVRIQIGAKGSPVGP